MRLRIGFSENRQQVASRRHGGGNHGAHGILLIQHIARQSMMAHQAQIISRTRKGVALGLNSGVSARIRRARRMPFTEWPGERMRPSSSRVVCGLATSCSSAAAKTMLRQGAKGCAMLQGQ